MTEVVLDAVNKVYPDGFHAVRDLRPAHRPTASCSCCSGRRAAESRPSCAWSPGWRRSPRAACGSAASFANHLPPRERDLAMVFQNGALYPHRDVRGNIAFPLEVSRRQHRGRRPAHRRAVPRARHRGDTPPAALDAVRRPAAARRDGPGADQAARDLPHGRAAVEPRRGPAHRAADGDRRPRTLSRRDHAVRHPRPDRGPHARRPRRHPAPRHPAGRRHAPAGLRRPGHDVHRGVPELPADQPRPRLGACRPERGRRAGHRRPAPAHAVVGPEGHRPGLPARRVRHGRHPRRRPAPGPSTARSPDVSAPWSSTATSGWRTSRRAWRSSTPRRSATTRHSSPSRATTTASYGACCGRRGSSPRRPPSSHRRTEAPTAARTWSSGWSPDPGSRPARTSAWPSTPTRMLLFGEDGRRIDPVQRQLG